MIKQFTSSDIETILCHMSAALKYLSEEKVVHYDIKPDNIIYSSARGAVLIDFEAARFLPDPADENKEEPGGTLLYLPPESLEPGIKRGYPGDIWALGVTMLLTLGKIQYTPPSHAVFLNEMKIKGTGVNKWMEDWFEKIVLQRSLLNKEERVELLVSKMLEPDREARLTAAALPEGGPSPKKQKHS